MPFGWVEGGGFLALFALKGLFWLVILTQSLTCALGGVKGWCGLVWRYQ